MKYRMQVTLEDGGVDFIEVLAASPEIAKDLAMEMDGVMGATIVKVIPRAGGYMPIHEQESTQNYIDDLVGM